MKLEIRKHPPDVIPVDAEIIQRMNARLRCDSCQLVSINGFVCHEIGCPNTPRACLECGASYPAKNLFNRICSGCRQSYADDEEG